MLAKKANRSERCMLKGSLRKCGFEGTKLVFTAFSERTGEERVFFVEFVMLNPALSPKECVLGFKNRLPATEEALQHALAGTEAAMTANQEQLVQPSFTMVRAGTLGAGGKQMSAYYPCSQVRFGKSDALMTIGASKSACVLGEHSSAGSVRVSYSELSERPELLCDVGGMAWNLRFEKHAGFTPNYSGKSFSWAALGVCTEFEGMVNCDGEMYKVVPQKSYGYVDKMWGKDFAYPYFHLSSSNLTSIISGRRLDGSGFVAKGVFDDKLSVLALIGQSPVEFHAKKRSGYSVTFECSETPEDGDGTKVHWSVSVHNKKTVMDIDIFCQASALFVRDYESPVGGRKVLKVLGGGTGTGEIRLYRQVRKNLELMEHATIANAVCEFGNAELP